MEFSRRIASALVVLVSLGAALPALAQDTRGRVQGTIADTSGGAIPGVTVTLANDATGIAVSRESGDTGRYLFDQVDPGVYTITAVMPGFATLVQKNVRVHQRGDVTADITLKVSEIAETVTVEASPVAVQFNTTQHEMTVEQSLFTQLPMVTRNPATLIGLDPSTNMPDPTRTGNIDHYAANAYDVGGMTAGQNDVLIDGSPLANSSKLGYNPPIEAVGEFTVRSNAVDAEFGHSAGGIVTMSMRSGTNQIHGSAYYFGGVPNWNAINNRITRQHSKNTFWNGGGTVGLPIIKNKLFLFTAYEKQTDTSYRALTYTLPTALERAGDFSQSVNADGTPRIIYDPLSSRIEGGKIVRDAFPGNKIPAARWDPLSKRILQSLWDVNNPGDDLTGLNNFKYDDYRYYRYYNLSNRVDWQINERWKTFGRVSFFRTNQPANDYTNGKDVLKMRRTEGSIRNGTNIAGDTVYTFSPTTVLTVRGSYYKTEDKRDYPEMDIGEAGYHDLWASDWWKPYAEGRPLIYFPNMQIPSGDTFGVRNFWYQEPYGLGFGAVLNKNLTSHALKVGYDTRFKRGEASRFGFANLTFAFNNTANTSASPSSKTGHPWASFLMGALDTASNAQYMPMQSANTEMYAFFVQDDFKIRRNLTLNLGLRYEYEGGYWDPENRIPQRLDLTDPIPGLEAGIAPKLSSVQAGGTGKTVAQLMAESAGPKSYLYNGAFYFSEDGNKRATQSDKYQFMPRLGLAYRMDDRTAIRIGYARFYTPNALTDGGNEPLGSLDLSAFSPTTSVLPLINGVPQAFLSDPFPQGLTPAYGKSYGRYTALGDTITIDEYERRPPISDRINLTLQREIWGRTVVDVTYLMNFVSRNMLTVDLNLADPRLTYKYGVELTKTVANPFYNYGTVETFPGALRRQATVSVGTLLRPYPQYGAINQTSTDLSKFRHQSLEVRLQRPFAHGFTFLATYARVVEKSQVFYDNQDQYDGILTWNDNVNPRHRFVTANAFEIPIGRNRWLGADMPRALDWLIGGWQISSIYTYRSGQLLTFLAMTAPTSVTKLGGVGKGAYWFDVTQFSTLPAYTRRTNPNYYDNLRGPTYSNLDAVLSKRITIHENMKFECRLEAYNALNGWNWANPTLTITSSDFGRTNSPAAGYAGRRLQYVFRLEF